eukprot:4915654-Pleurochrysis_carterae.AAC.1
MAMYVPASSPFVALAVRGNRGAARGPLAAASSSAAPFLWFLHAQHRLVLRLALRDRVWSYQVMTDHALGPIKWCRRITERSNG